MRYFEACESVNVDEEEDFFNLDKEDYYIINLEKSIFKQKEIKNLKIKECFKKYEEKVKEKNKEIINCHICKKEIQKGSLNNHIKLHKNK